MFAMAYCNVNEKNRDTKFFMWFNPIAKMFTLMILLLIKMYYNKIVVIA